MTVIMYGKPVAEAMGEKITADVEELARAGAVPCLATIRVGARADDIAYERGAVKRCGALGIETRVCELPPDVSEYDFMQLLARLNEDPEVHGILPFRPLPPRISAEALRGAITPFKDIDCISHANIAHAMVERDFGFHPCAPVAVMEMLRHYGIDVAGRSAVMIGRSLVVGKPLAMLMLAADATVTVCHTKTADLRSVARDADVIVSAMGHAKMIDASYVKKGAVVFDVGINADGTNGLCGDVDFEAVAPVASAITPVPGGVGAVTTSVLARHVVDACRISSRL